MKMRNTAERINHRIKMIMALLIIPLLMIGMLAAKPDKASADPVQTVTVQFDIGSNHEALAQKVLDAYLEDHPDWGTRSGSVLTLKVLANLTVNDVLSNLYDYVFYAMPAYLDNGERYIDVGLHPVDNYNRRSDVFNEWEECQETPMSEQYNKFYALWGKKITNINATVAAPKCGTQVTVKSGSGDPNIRPLDQHVTEIRWFVQEPQPEVTFSGKQYSIGRLNEKIKLCYWLKDKQMIDLGEDLFEGKMIGGNSYYVGISVAPEFGYFDYEVLPTAKINGRKADVIISNYDMGVDSAEGKTRTHSVEPKRVGSMAIIGEVEAVHNWDNGKVTKKPTTSAPGEKTFTCKGCGKMRTEPIPALGGKSPMLVMTSKGAKAMKLKVSAALGASGYEIFMSRCNGPEKRAPKKVKTFNKGKSFTWTKGGLKPNVVYKAYVKAYKIEDGKKVYIAKSPLMHALTNAAGGRRTNPSSVTVKKAKVSLAAGKSARIKAKVKSLIPGRALPAASHGKKLRYMSSDSSIATVSASGRITGKAAGKCKVYAYAINGACKAVNVTVK